MKNEKDISQDNSPSKQASILPWRGIRRWMIKPHHIEEGVAKILMVFSFLLVAFSLLLILITVVVKGLPALSWAMITQTPKGGYYLGKEGGILNAIIGSLYLAIGATFLAFVISIPIALYMKTYEIGRASCRERV